LAGTIPDAWLRLPSLEKLRLKVNNISGTLPAAGDLSGLVLSELRLDSNHISGAVEMHFIYLWGRGWVFCCVQWLFGCALLWVFI
jgi:hypothetical protein